MIMIWKEFTAQLKINEAESVMMEETRNACRGKNEIVIIGFSHVETNLLSYIASE